MACLGGLLDITTGSVILTASEVKEVESYIDQIIAENAKLRDGVAQMYGDMQGVLDMSTDTVWVDSISTLRDKMDWYMLVMAELGMPPVDYEKRMRELGMEVDG